MQKLTLFLFASPLQITLGLFQNDKIINAQKQNLNQDLIENLFPLLNALLSKSKTNLKAINKIFAGIGPGSYTSGRILGVFLRTMKIIQKDIEIFTINNFLWLAGTQKKQISLINANKKEYFLAGYNQGELVIDWQRILKSKLSTFKKAHSEFEFVEETSNFDLETRFKNLKSYFKYEKNYEKIKPITEIS